MSFTEVLVNPPARKTGEYPDQPLRLWAVRVWEEKPPQGVEPLEWILLTNVPVETADDARERVSWYECRFVIEEYHKGMKTGCGIEQLQLTSISRLEPAIGVLSALPTHTPTTRFGVNPTTQLSRKSVVVPVFAAAGRPMFNALFAPNARILAFESLKMSLIRYATRSSITRTVCADDPGAVCRHS